MKQIKSLYHQSTLKTFLYLQPLLPRGQFVKTFCSMKKERLLACLQLYSGHSYENVFVSCVVFHHFEIVFKAFAYIPWKTFVHVLTKSLFYEVIDCWDAFCGWSPFEDDGSSTIFQRFDLVLVRFARMTCNYGAVGEEWYQHWLVDGPWTQYCYGAADYLKDLAFTVHRG